MSWRACKRVWDSFRPGGALKLTLLALADYGDPNGDRIYPSMQALAAKVGMSEAQARRYVGRLVRMGAIECVRNLYGGKPGATRHYRIVFDALTGCEHATRRGGTNAPREVQDGLHTCAETGCKDARDGLQTSTETGCEHATQTESEPKVNRLKNRERAIASPLPLDFRPSLADCEWTKSELQERGTEVGDYEQWQSDELAKFIANRQSSGRRSMDWSAEWQKWMLNAFAFEARHRQGRVGVKTAPSRHNVRPADYGQTGAIE